MRVTEASDSRYRGYPGMEVVPYQPKMQPTEGTEMGWWRVEGRNEVLGDEPLDVLGAAVTEVISSYQTRFNRKPTTAEWESLLLAVLGAEEPESRALDEGRPKRVSIET
jgi:hypothetical protein